MLLIICSSNFYAQTNTLSPAVVTNAKPTANEILQALNGGGLTLSNPKISSGSIDKWNGYTQKNGSQIAIFEGGTKANLGMDKGVLFSTGDAVADLNSKNNNYAVSYSIGQRAYDNALMGIYKDATYDVVIYEFDVTMASHTTALRVAFQFGSEEYPNFVGSVYNDAFGFFVSGPGIVDEKGKLTTVNMARNPLNSNTISVNTINAGYRGKSSFYPTPVDLTNGGVYINNGHPTKTEQTSYGSNKYYQIIDNNDQNTNYNKLPKPVYIEYNGLTKLITYDLTGLQGGQTYKFKIAIADSGDTQYDSGVIIQKIQGTTGADVKVQKEINKKEVKIGEEVEFTLTATNLGPYDGKGVKVTDKLPSGYTFINATPSVGTFDEKTGVWTIGNLQAIHQTATLKVKALVNAFGDYTNKASITSNDPDPDPDNNTSEITPKVNRGFQCFNDIVGNGFDWKYKAGASGLGSTVEKTIDQPASDGGFVLDIYKLDNSFNMIINGKPLFKEEIELETNHANRNLRFKASKKPYGSDYAVSVWEVNKNEAIYINDRLKNPTPVIRVVINQDGVATLYGKRDTNALLEELEVYEKTGKKNDTDANVAKAKTLSLNSVDWKKQGAGTDVNKITVKQNVIGETLMAGFGYGQQIKECETCTVDKDGELKAINPKNVKVGEVITYTFKVKNLGDMDIHDVKIIDPLFGFDITLDPTTHKPIPDNVTIKGDVNGNGVLNMNETWVFTVDYKVTSNDIYKTKGVYNRATVTGTGRSNADTMPIQVDSKDPTPYKVGDEGWDPERPFHTYVPLKGQGLFISNPHIYQRLK
ncbi:choice-of-anchor L domain-containing protein [Myroides odoratimimus]|uniref:choice-of-anchor L domain-containing protein n=1 Tax=Myroides odoratimimus TaxID=76832 RepID=UPI002DBD9402|nr:choice-of-anchor L domain-containing protein [Myroides odoratimimus]MEC4054282.1 choice-of-anchor L domain-containing protein [Myroides odoratimimus]